MVAHMRECKIVLHDSFQSREYGNHMLNFLEYLKKEAIDKTGLSLIELSGIDNWTMVYADDVHQINSSACGLYTCIGIECVSLNMPLIMSNDEQEEFFRRKIGIDIMTSILPFDIE